MIGRPLTVAFPERAALAEQAEVVLAVSGLRGERFGPVDLVVRKGEILGIAGAEGNGQVPFLRALAGIEPAIGERILRRREARHALAGADRSARASSCSAATGAARRCSRS